MAVNDYAISNEKLEHITHDVYIRMGRKFRGVFNFAFFVGG